MESWQLVAKQNPEKSGIPEKNWILRVIFRLMQIAEKSRQKYLHQFSRKLITELPLIF